VIKTCYNSGQKERLCLNIDKCRRQKLCKRAQKTSAAAPLRVITSAVVSIVVRNTIFRKAPPSVVYGYGERSINLNKVVATFEKHTFLSQTELTRTGIISNSYNEIYGV
jgi:hypothetical protein